MAGSDHERGSWLPAALSRFFEHSAGGLTGESGAAAGTVRTFALVSIVSTAAFAIRYAVTPQGLPGPVAWVDIVSVLVFVAALVLVRAARQAAAALVYLLGAIAGMIAMAFAFGWAAGHHLYLIAAAQLVFLMFTDRQRAWRWFIVVVSAGAFLVAQLATPGLGPYSDGPRVSTTFAMNAIGTATLMFVLSVVAHHRARAARAEAERLASHAEYLANTDPLTGLSNRRPVTARLEQLAGAEGRAYCVAIADLDRFKELNDVYGHACGDKVLAELGDRLRGEVRATDALGRWGGEEFIFVLADSALADAGVMMERMRSIVRDRPIDCGEHQHTVTVSVGVADGVADGMSHRVVKRADDALYEAKLAGRDRVHLHPYGEPGSSRTSARHGG